MNLSPSTDIYTLGTCVIHLLPDLPGVPIGVMLDDKGEKRELIIAPDKLTNLTRAIMQHVDTLLPHAVACVKRSQRTESAEDRAYRRGVEDAAKVVPTTWLDPLLSVDEKVAEIPYDGHDVERLLCAVKDRIRALLPEVQAEEETP